MSEQPALHPQTTDPDMTDGVQARLHDPLWLLGRQWQFDELAGSDGGSPAVVELAVDHAPLSRYRPRGGRAQDWNPNSTVLDALVEAEAPLAPQQRSLAQRVAAGRHATRLLRQRGALVSSARLRSAYSLADEPMPPWADDAAPLLSALVGRSLDGARLRAALLQAAAAGQRLPKEPPLPPQEQDAAAAALQEWLAWDSSDGGQEVTDPGAWQPDRMEHAFSVSARMPDAERSFDAPEHLGGGIDWPTFDASTEQLGAHLTAETHTPRVLATPATYRGMPADRLWAFEDAQVNLAAIGADGQDVARLVVLWFALVYSDDWFVVPVELPSGSVCRVAALDVTDTFQRSVSVPHVSAIDGPASPWRMFTPTGQDDLFVLAPTLTGVLESESIEDVLLVRDEMANLAWAVEHIVQGGAGGRVDRYGQNLADRHEEGGSVPPVSTDADLIYRLGVPSPPNWLPLVPTDTTGMTLRLGRLPVDVVGVGGTQPWGRLLAPANLLIREEEVLREGVVVQRRQRHARSSDGTHHVWVGRSKGPAFGEASSGLRFDTVDETL